MNGKELHLHSRRPFLSVLLLAFMLCLTGFSERTLFAAAPAPRVRFDPGTPPDVPPDVPPQVLIEAPNESFTFKVRFKNDISVPGAMIGYGPFIDLVLDAGGANITKTPPCACDGMTFVQANMIDVNGGAVPLVYHQSVASPCTSSLPVSPNHPFQSSGVSPVVVPAGSQLVTIELPFGSFDPTQPEIVVEVTAHVSNLADVTPPYPLKIYARGGFRYGSLDALDNPNLDPPVLSDVSANSTQWAANEQTTPTVLIVTKKYLGPEDETATGPNFIHQYAITLDIATGQTVNNVTVTDHLPNNMAYVATVGSPTTTACFFPPFQQPTPNVAHAGPAANLILKCPSIIGVPGPDATIVFEFFIPQLDAFLQPVLSPTCAFVQSINDIKAEGDWTQTPIDPCDTSPVHVVSDVTPADHTLLDKCLAIQKSVAVVNDTGATGPTPGDTLRYTLNFQLSDFRTAGNLKVHDVLSDGQTLDPASLRLTVTDQCGPTVTGPIPASAWTNQSFLLCGVGGVGVPPPLTQLNIDVSAAMISLPHPGILTGGYATFVPSTVPATGTITFQTHIDDAYLCPVVSPHDLFVDKDDPLTNTVTLTADILANSAACSTTLNPTGVIAQDDSKTAIAIVTDFLEKTVYAIHRPNILNPNICGPNTTYITTPCPSNPEVFPFDEVTFRLKKTIPSGDAENLTIRDWLPLPTFLVAGGPFLYSQCGLPANGSGCFGPANNLVPPVVGANVPSYFPTGLTNSILFDYGTFSYLPNQPLIIDLLFTRAVTNTPFADGLYLTNEAQECESNTFGVTFCQAAIAQVHVREPALKITKGVVAASNPNAVFSPPPVTFQAPGTSCPRFNGTINPITSGSAINSNVSNVDANDCVTFAIVVENTGGSTAYDIKLRDLFPLGPTDALECFAPDFTTLCVRDGTGAPIQFTSGTSFHGSLPITLSTPLPGLTSTTLPGENIVVITFDACIVGNIKPHCCDNTAILDSYSSTPGADGVSGPNFVGAGFGGPFQDTAQVCVRPTAAKSIKTTSEAHTPSSAPEQLAIGEIIRYHLVVVVPETTSASNYILTDLLPPGLQFLNDNTTKLALVSNGGISSTPLTGPSLLVSGNQPTITPTFQLLSGITPGSACGSLPSLTSFNLGNLTNSDNDFDQEFIVLEFNALVCNIASNVNPPPTVLANRFAVIVDGSQVATSNIVNAVVVEPKLTITKAVSPNPVVQGGTVTYTVTITNSGTATAFDVAFTDTLPTDLTPVTSLTFPLGWTGGIIGQNVNVTCNTPSCSGVPVGGVVTITYQAKANPATCPVKLTNQAKVTWTSLPGLKGTTTNLTGSSTPGNSGALDGERDGSTAPALPNKYAAITSASLGVSCPPCVDLSSLPNMVAWYPLDEQDGATAVTDIAPPPGSIVNNVGTPKPGPVGAGGPTPVAGQVAGALYFTGPYVEVPPQAELDFGRGDFSIDAWVRPVDCSHGGGGVLSPIVDKFNGPTTGFSFYLDQPTVGVAHVYLNMNGSTFVSSGSNGTIPTLGSATWSHIAVTVARPLSGTAVGTFYINGLPAGTFTPPAGSVTNTLPMWIGKTRVPGGSCEIAIDELEIFNRALQQGEIASIAGAKSAGKCKCLRVSNDKISCNPNGTFTYTFTVTNLSTSTVSGVSFAPPAGVTITPGSIPASLPPGASTTVTVTISGLGAVSGATICFSVALVGQGAVICRTDHCITLPKCCIPPPSNMAAWWPLDETVGTVVADIVGNHNGTPMQGSLPATIGSNGPHTAPAKVNNGLGVCFFPPGPALFVTVADSAALNFGTAQSFSIDAWINPAGNSPMIVDKLNFPNPAGGYRLYVSTNRLKLDIGGTAFTGTAVVTPGNWNHVAVTVDRQNQRVTFYVNGTPEVVGGDTTSLNASSSGLNLLIGGTYDTGLLGCEYMLDEIEIFNGVVTAQDILAIYQADSSGKCKSQQGQICIAKFEDLNRNGRQDGGEPLLPGWTFNVTDQNNILVGTITTNPAVQSCLTVLAPGTYTITEQVLPPWVPTTPNPRTVTASPGQTVNLTFGNWILHRRRAVQH